MQLTQKSTSVLRGLTKVWWERQWNNLGTLVSDGTADFTTGWTMCQMKSLGWSVYSGISLVSV